MWLGPVNSLTPNGTFFVEWDALWMEQASGISLDRLVFTGGTIPGTHQTAYVDRELLVDLLENKCASRLGPTTVFVQDTVLELERRSYCQPHQNACHF
jgi:hypothetical protein